MTGQHDVLQQFARQAAACEQMGSPFTAQLCRVLAAHLDRSTAFGQRILDWEGDPFDDNVALRACGALHALARGGREPYLAARPPKSTGRELFQMEWLERHLEGRQEPADVQATLLEFTALAIARSISEHCNGTEEIFVCGGGARNPALMERLRVAAAGRLTATTDSLGIPSGHVEAMAFAWLAMQCVDRRPVDMTAVTGARGPRILGCLYPA